MRSNVNILVAIVLGGGLASPAQFEHCQTPAQWRRLAKKAVPGTLLLDDDGVEFRSAKFSQRWAYVEIHSFDLSTRELKITGYQNRHWHEPGEQRFQFTLSEPMPPEIAAQLTERVGKPVRNGIPLPGAAAMRKSLLITACGPVEVTEPFG